MMNDQRRANVDERLYGTKVRWLGPDGLRICFFEDGSDFDGNDFDYIYSLDGVHAKRFYEMISNRAEGDEPEEAAFKEWLVDHVDCSGIGLDLKAEWIRRGLHGTVHVHEDYPGGIDRTETF